MNWANFLSSSFLFHLTSPRIGREDIMSLMTSFDRLEKWRTSVGCPLEPFTNFGCTWKNRTGKLCPGPTRVRRQKLVSRVEMIDRRLPLSCDDDDEPFGERHPQPRRVARWHGSRAHPLHPPAPLHPPPLLPHHHHPHVLRTALEKRKRTARWPPCLR